MTEVNPCAWILGAGATHTAENERLIHGAMMAGRRTSTSTLRTRGGVNPDLFATMAVTAKGTPAMAVDVAAGIIFIPGSEGVSQGTYTCVNDGTVSKTITTAHATLPRIDIVVARVYDQQYSGALNQWAIEVIAGTPASSPAVPTSPNNSITLAEVLVGAGVTSIVSGNITDRRPFAAALGGIIKAPSFATLPVANLMADGQFAYTQDTDQLYYCDGTTWKNFYRGLKQPTCVARLSANQSIPDNASTLIVWDTEEFDNCSGFAPPSNTLTVPEAGVYDVTLSTSLTSNANGVRFMELYVGGSIEAGQYAPSIGAGTPHTMSCSLRMFIAAGTGITSRYYQNSGSALNLSGTVWHRSRLSFTKVTE